MHVGAAERLRQHLTRLVRQNQTVRVHPPRELADLGMACAEADDRHDESSRSRRNVVARTRLSRFCACPTLPECMTTNLSASPCSRAQSFSRGPGTTNVVSTQFGITVMRSGSAPFAISRSRIRSADRDDVVGALEIEADQATQHADERADWSACRARLRSPGRRPR